MVVLLFCIGNPSKVAKLINYACLGKQSGQKLNYNSYKNYFEYNVIEYKLLLFYK